MEEKPWQERAASISAPSSVREPHATALSTSARCEINYCLLDVQGLFAILVFTMTSRG